MILRPPVGPLFCQVTYANACGHAGNYTFKCAKAGKDVNYAPLDVIPEYAFTCLQKVGQVRLSPNEQGAFYE